MTKRIIDMIEELTERKVLPPADEVSAGEQLHLGQVEVGHHARGIGVVQMRGEHDLRTQPGLAHALEIAAAHSNVVVDLTECSFIDSTIIKEFIKSSVVVRAKGEQLMLVIPAEQAAVVRIAEDGRARSVLQAARDHGGGVRAPRGSHAP